jgi:O-succinylhomoserine sulfhydrylase
MADHKRHFETNAIRQQTPRSAQREHSVPIYATSSFVFEDAEQARAMFANEIEGNIYSRFSNPNNDEFIDKLCLLEGAEAGIATASGMSAMFISIASFLKSGDHVLASRSLFGSTHQIMTQLLPRWNISHTYVSINEPESWEAQIQPNTKMIFVETPSNPGLDLLDLEWLGKLAEKHQLILNVDNCFATPYLQNPLTFGAHIVTHSATKFIDGQGRALGGAILGSKDLIKEIKFMARHTGPAMSPFNGWILSKSLETLAVRMDRHCQNALALATELEQHDEVISVKYPFLPSHPQHALAKKQMRLGGGLFTFELKGGIERGRRFLDSLEMLSLTANLGDTRTICTHPASTTHSKLSEEEQAAVGITPGLIRVSVGLEHVEDVMADLMQAIERSA